VHRSFVALGCRGQGYLELKIYEPILNISN
jgi:hypothetical protein